MDIEVQLLKNNERDVRIAFRKRRWSTRLRDASSAVSDAGADPAQSVSPATRAHAQACDHVEEVFRSFNVENDAVLAKQDASDAQQAGTLASLLEDIQTETQAHEVRQLAEQTAVLARIAELMQMVDPQRMVVAIASLMDTIHTGSNVTDALVRRSEGLQLVWHGQYLAALAAHEEAHDTLVAAMAEQLLQLQGACSRQLAALDTLHTQEEQAGLAADQANITRSCNEWQTAGTTYAFEQMKAVCERQDELQQLRAERAELCRSLRTRLDSENNQLEQACASTRARNLIEAETQKLAHEKVHLLGPDQLRAVQAHGLRLSHAQQLLAALKRMYVETERVFAKENVELGQEFRDVTSKMQELQAREVALHAAASARVQEVKQINEKELNLLEQQLQQTTRRIAASLHSGRGWEDHDAVGPCDGEPALASCTESPAGRQRSWVLLEKALARTCAAWQDVDADQQQIMNLQQKHLALMT